MPFKNRRQGAVARDQVSVPRLFYCTVAGLVIAIVLSFLFGASGLFNYHNLRAYEAHVTDGIVALQDRYRGLQQRVAVLRDNPEALRLLARETGYFRAGETAIEVGPAPVEPTAAAGAHSGREFVDVAPLLQRTPPAPRDPFNALALGLFLGVGSFAMLSILRAFRRRSQAGAAPGAGAPSNQVHEQPKRASRRVPRPRAPVSGRGVADSGPAGAAASATPPDGAAGASPARDERAAPATPEPGGEAAPDGAGRRRKARRRRRDVTVYRL